jgi:multicomponent K+:H+ antiporter subunit C
MAVLLALMIGAMVAAGVWLLLRPRSWSAVLGLVLLSNAVNLFIVAAGRIGAAAPPVLGDGGARAAAMADPLPQALVLTAIVIGLGMTAFLVALALRARAAQGNDQLGEGPLPDGTTDAERGQ